MSSGQIPILRVGTTLLATVHIELRDDVAERGKPRRAEGDKAMAAVIAAIRQSAERGDIKLRTPEEDEEE